MKKELAGYFDPSRLGQVGWEGPEPPFSLTPTAVTSSPD